MEEHLLITYQLEREAYQDLRKDQGLIILYFLSFSNQFL